MSPSPTSEARKRREEKATPEPVTFPEPFIPTTMERVRQVGSGKVAVIESTDLADVYWWDWNDPEWSDNEIVLWRPSPPRKDRALTAALDGDK